MGDASEEPAEFGRQHIQFLSRFLIIFLFFSEKTEIKFVLELKDTLWKNRNYLDLLLWCEKCGWQNGKQSTT